MTFAGSENGNPFPGLHSFTRKQAHLFFGRDQQVKDLLARLREHRFLPIVGMSGSGKSSLVQAGLIPTLTGSYVATNTSGWRIAVLRPGRRPMHELAATLCHEFDVRDVNGMLQILRGSTAGLAQVAQQHLADGEKLLILVDQFEELFRYGPEANAEAGTNDAASFVKLLLAAAGESEHSLPGFDDLQVYVVTTMRLDYFVDCSRFRGLPEALNRSQYLIPRLTREQQRDVIEGPVGMAGSSIEPALVQRLLNDLGDNPSQLPALQHSLMRTWEETATARSKGTAITVADYEAIGGMADALNRDADRLYKSLSASEETKSIIRLLFQRLVRPGAPDNSLGSPTPFSELSAIIDADDGDLKDVIKAFQKPGFITISNDPDPVVDIAYENLIASWRQLTAWTQDEVRSATIYSRLVETASLHAENGASWLIDPELQLTLNWHETTNPGKAWASRYDQRYDQAIEFLEQSRKKQRRRVLRRLIGLVLGTLLVFALILVGIEWRRIATEQSRSSRLLYDTNIYFASSALATGQFTLARKRLDELVDAGLQEMRGFEWFLLWRASHADEATLVGNSGSVFSVAFSPDGKILASGNDSNTVILWDAVTHEKLTTLSGHSSAVVSVAFSPDGKTIASASADKTVKLWNTDTSKEVATFPGSVLSVRFSPDGKFLACASTDNTVKLWNTVSREATSLEGHSASVFSIAFSPDGKLLASGSEDTFVKLWDLATHKEVANLPGHVGSVVSVAFSPDGKTLASASYDKLVKLWDITKLEALYDLRGHSDHVRSVAFSSDGTILASASADKTIKLWNAATGKEVHTLAGHDNPVSALVFSPNSDILASASNDTMIKLWNTSALRDVVTLEEHSGPVFSVALSPNDKILASASADKSVKLWDASTRKPVTTLTGHTDTVTAVAFSPDGNYLASASADKTVKLWSTATYKQLFTLSNHRDVVRSIAFSPDSRTLASASSDGTVKLWTTDTGIELATLTGHSGYVFSVAFSPDGKSLGSVGADKTVRLWDIPTRSNKATLIGHSAPVLSVVFSPDGKSLATASNDNIVKLWEISSETEILTLSTHLGAVVSLAFSADGKTLASASTDKTVKLWDVATGKEVATLSGHSDYVRSVTFSSDGKTLITAGDDHTVKLWFAATDEEVKGRRWRDY